VLALFALSASEIISRQQNKSEELNAFIEKVFALDLSPGMAVRANRFSPKPWSQKHIANKLIRIGTSRNFIAMVGALVGISGRMKAIL
jgi:hypothetical protein